MVSEEDDEWLWLTQHWRENNHLLPRGREFFGLLFCFAFSFCLRCTWKHTTRRAICHLVCSLPCDRLSLSTWFHSIWGKKKLFLGKTKFGGFENKRLTFLCLSSLSSSFLFLLKVIAPGVAIIEFLRLFCDDTWRGVYSSLHAFFGFSPFLLFPIFLLPPHYLSVLPSLLPSILPPVPTSFPGITGCQKRPSITKANLFVSQLENQGPESLSPILLDPRGKARVSVSQTTGTGWTQVSWCLLLVNLNQFASQHTLFLSFACSSAVMSPLQGRSLRQGTRWGWGEGAKGLGKTVQTLQRMWKPSLPDQMDGSINLWFWEFCMSMPYAL